MKIKRLQAILGVYETIHFSNLIKPVLVGQMMNLLLIFRVGDIYKISFNGNKNLKNGFPLSISSYIIEIIIDAVTVMCCFFALYVLNIHRELIFPLLKLYMLLCFIIIFSLSLIINHKLFVKKVIKKYAEIFNPNIELNILTFTYALLSFFKTKVIKHNIVTILKYNLGVWLCYLISYEMFSKYLVCINLDFTLTSVFSYMFLKPFLKSLVDIPMVNNIFMWFVFLSIVLSYIFSIFLTKNITSHSTLSILPHSHEKDKLQFLNIYFNNEFPEYLHSFSQITNEICIIKDLSAGSNATVILAQKNNTFFYRKYLIDKNTDTLVKQYKWIQEYCSKIPCVEVLDFYVSKTCCYYDMKYYSDSTTFYDVIHTVPVHESLAIIINIFDKFDNVLFNPIKPQVNEIECYIQEKVIRNYNICKEWCMQYYNEIWNNDIVYINKRKFKSMSRYEQFIKEHLQKIFNNDFSSPIHGDLTIENIICRDNIQNPWYIIDPNNTVGFSSSYFDYSKILQSLHSGYEFLHLVDDFSVFENSIHFRDKISHAYVNLYNEYHDFLTGKFSYFEIKSIYYHELVHWFRLMPYKIKSNPKKAVIYFAKLLMLLQELEEKFDE